MEKPSNNFCPAPFMHTYVNANNSGYKLCCMSHIIGRWDTTGDINAQFQEFWTSDEMQDIRLSFLADKMPSPCEWWCGRWEKEGLEHKSDRLKFIRKWQRDHPELEWDIEYGNTNYKQPVDVDFRPSRKCNIKCRSCNSTWSDQIEKEVAENPEIQGWGHWDTPTKPQTYEMNLEFNHVKKLSMSGGETLVDEGVLSVMRKLCEEDRAKDIHLHMITNGTVLPKKSLDMLAQFQKVTFSLSIDGIGKTDEHLRYGTKWDKKLINIHKLFQLPNLWYIDIMHVFQWQSAFRIEENFAFFKELDERYGDKLLQVTYNPIVDPWYLSVSSLDNDHKKELMDTINKLEANDKQRQWLKLAISELEKDQEPEMKLTWQNDFVRANNALDKIRGENTLDIFPELKRYYDRYDPTNLTPDKGKGANPGAMFGGRPKPAASHRTDSRL